MSKTSDTKVSELQKEIDGLKMISSAQQLRIQELEKKITGTCRNDCVLRKKYSKKDSIISLNPRYDARNVRDVTMGALKILSIFWV